MIEKGFYGHEAQYDNQIKIIQDPVSGQILPPNLLEYWWSNTLKLNEQNPSITNLKRVLNEKELREEFAEIFSQKGCNKSVVCISLSHSSLHSSNSSSLTMVMLIIH